MVVVGGGVRGRKGSPELFGSFSTRTSLQSLAAVCVLFVDGTAHHPDTMQQFCRNVPRHAVSRLRARRAYATLAAEFKPGDSVSGFTVNQVQRHRLEQEKTILTLTLTGKGSSGV
jgi:hypothetical protein